MYLDKLTSTGVLISSLGCAACFPALGSLGAAIGLGFLSAYEGLIINALLPLFVIAGVLVNLYGWRRHRVHRRGVLSILGPVIILAALYPFWRFGWSRVLFYVGLTLMLAVSIFDAVSPPQAAPCRT